MVITKSFSKASKWLSKLHRSKATAAAPAAASASAGDRPPTARASQYLTDAFSRFDTDGDGKVSIEELRAFLSLSGDQVSPAAAEGVVSEADSDGDGLLDYMDFVRLVESGTADDLRMAFEMFGATGITAGGLSRVLRRLGDDWSHEACAAMIRPYDVDGDGVLDYGEFSRMMTT